MTKGILVFARNNSQVDYVKQAYVLAKRADAFLNLPVSIVTDSPEYLKKTYHDYDDVFDKIIDISQHTQKNKNLKNYFDGSLTQKQLEFKNDTRIFSYELSPYSSTVVLDTDFVIANNNLNYCFKQNRDFLIYKDAYDLCGHRDISEFTTISDTGPDFYWATAFYFRKSETTKIFFDLLKHINENYEHYLKVYQIPARLYRNDHAFSIAIHILNGFQKGSFAGKMPGKLYYTTDRDFLTKVNQESLQFLIEKKDYLGEYTLIKTTGLNVHVMNKFSLGRMIDKELSDG